MNLGAILIGIALLVAAVPYVASPLLDQRKRGSAKAAAARQPAAPKSELNPLIALRDLDFDYRTGKVVTEDFETLRAQLMAEAAGLIEAKQREDERLEALIQSRKKPKAPVVKCQKCDRLLQATDKFCPACGEPVRPDPNPAAIVDVLPVCQKCGRKITADSRYCPACGAALKGSTE
ncbi:MAG TPA: zinc ribbon domain-containing protein [Anaerolineales bacterium]